MFSYVVSCQRPTSISHTLSGAVLSPNTRNLVLAKHTLLEIHYSTREGLSPAFSVPLYGRVVAVALIRLPFSKTDSIALLTDRLQFMVLTYDPAAQEMRTLTNAVFMELAGRRAESGPIMLVDPSGQFVLIHMYSGLLRIVPTDEGRFKAESFNVRLDEFNVLDMCLCDSNEFAVLYRESNEKRMIRSYNLQMDAERTVKGWCAPTEVNALSRKLLGTPSGVLVFTDTSVVYMSSTTTVSVEKPEVLVVGVCKIDEARFLVSHLDGSVTLVLLIMRKNLQVAPVQLKVVPLGNANGTIANTMTYVDNGVVFMGSSFGDSVLVRLSDDRGMEVLQSYANLGPITDLVTIPQPGQGDRIVTCSGCLKEGSMRIWSKGLGIATLAEMDVEGVKGLWALGKGDYLVHSFIEETRVLGKHTFADGDELVEIDSGFITTQSTIHAADDGSGGFLQVTELGVSHLSATLTVLGEYKANDLALAASWGIRSLVCDKTHVYLLKGAVEQHSLELECEASALGMGVVGLGASSGNDQLCVVALWSGIVCLLQTDGLAEVARYDTQASVRSIQCVAGGFVFCGMGEGILLVLSFNGDRLTLFKRVSLGSRPVQLSPIIVQGNHCVFIAGQHPLLAKLGRSGQLVLSNFNLPAINHSTGIAEDTVVLVSDSRLMIGCILPTPQMYVKKHPLGEQPRRLIHLPKSKMIALVSMRIAEDSVSEGIVEEAGFLRLFNDDTCELLWTYELLDFEFGQCICSMEDSDGVEWVILGTSINSPGQEEAKTGRLLAFEVDRDTCTAECEGVFTLSGGVSAIGVIDDSRRRVIATVNTEVLLLGLDRDGGFTEIQRQGGHMLGMFLKAQGSVAVVGDLMKSATLYGYDSVKDILQVLGKDYESKWCSSVELLAQDRVLVTDNGYNLHVMRREVQEHSEKGRLRSESRFHLGDFINVIRPGSLVPSEEQHYRPGWILGGMSGALYMLIDLSEDQYRILERVEEALEKIVFGIGDLQHGPWRDCYDIMRNSTTPRINMIDGDLMETMLDLDDEQVTRIAEEIDHPKDDLVQLVEMLTRIH